jgi:uncharacterized SAM-binding protein YcdF (DUF218 family)
MRRVLTRLLIAVTAIAVLGGVVWHCYPDGLNWLGEFLVEADQPEPADAILVLGGDFWGPRVLKGAELGASHLAPRVLISGPPYGNRPESELAIEFLVQKGYPSELFVSLPIEARSTIEEAIALAPRLYRLGIRRVILVTRASHSRRAMIVFRLFCPGIRFRSVPAMDDFQARRWWMNPESKRLFYLEWSKILGTVFVKYPEFQFHYFTPIHSHSH